MNSWYSFGQRHPKLGMHIEIDVGSRIIDCGEVHSISKIGNVWTGLDCDNAVGAAVRDEYLWRCTRPEIEFDI